MMEYNNKLWMTNKFIRTQSKFIVRGYKRKQLMFCVAFYSRDLLALERKCLHYSSSRYKKTLKSFIM